ncbi:p-hydroxybenzoic acid efflux subunit AaeA [Novipirellula aureliae]|uniref:p-hydroxybenzoic acid efflux subunit AaeA n=1 Tax=Novipirellula aureliae TaxID=2527966 RepID=A0A5C6E2A7_9BACT|nr:efflux RND transporter periplasmic adaptor subunit [Novipirellula aureliae]TWU43040.1 p-hydroxybenzoic acid efflux subunit AaeA [Novipirellula aureliae]
MSYLNFRIRLPLALTLLLLGIGLAKRSYAQSGLHAPAQTLVYDGFTRPLYDVMVAASEAGILRSVLVEEGDSVEKDQVIARLDDEMQRSAVEIAARQASMKGAVDAAVAERLLQEQRLRMLRELEAKNMSRPDEVRRAEADFSIAKAKLTSAEEQMELRKLELERYQLQLERRQIRAPSKGIISHLFLDRGEFVSPNEPVVARLLVVDRIVGIFNVPAEEIRFLSVGSPARVYFRSTGATLATTIHSIAPNIDGESGTVMVRVELDNANQMILAGDRCTLTLNRAPSGNAIHRKSNFEQSFQAKERPREVLSR